jgi:hypothetical protein
MTTITDHPAIRAAREAISRVRQAGGTYAAAIAQEQSLARSKPERKMEAVARLMAMQNPLIPGKAYTCSAAEAVAEIEPEYRNFCRQITEATCQRELARTELIATRLEAQLALAMVLDQEEL